jgi:hypothetical protein
MAQFRNVSGQDRDLFLPEWLGPRHVAADEVVDVDDELASRYDFAQQGVWETVTPPPAPAPLPAPAETPAPAPAEGDQSNVGSA